MIRNKILGQSGYHALETGRIGRLSVIAKNMRGGDYREFDRTPSRTLAFRR